MAARPTSGLSPRHRRLLPLALLTPALVAGLVGCSLAPTPENIVEGIVEQAAEQSGEDVDVDVDVDATGDGVSVPAGWPGLPLPEGRLFSATTVGETIGLSYEVESDDAARAVVDELIASGFENIAETDYAELKGAVLQSTEWSVIYGWSISDEGIIVSYSVTPMGS